MNTDFLRDTDATAQTLREACGRWPAFVEPMLRLLSATSDADERRRLKMRIAASIGNRDVLADIFGEAPDEFLSFYPDTQAPHLSTEQTIDAFIGRFGGESGAGPESGAQSADEVVPIAPPTVDYAATFLDAETDAADAAPADDATSSMLDSFLGAHPAPEAARRRPKPAAPAASLPASESPAASTPPTEPKATDRQRQAAPEPAQLTESLAKIMIKNRNYSKALEIIEALSLNNPEKSIYFADQIRFLRKLILNEEKKSGGQK